MGNGRKNINRPSCDRSGVTLVEAMVAMGLVAVALMAVLPLFSSSPKFAAYSDARALCQRLVKGKLDSLKTGFMMRESQFPGGSFAPYYLSRSDFAGIDGGSDVVTAFDYLKFLYNYYYADGICNGESSATVLNSAGDAVPVPPVLGLRACVKPHATAGAIETFGTDAAPPDCSANDVDQNAQSIIPGLKLYVKLELSTPWSPNTGAGWIVPGASQADASLTVNGRKYASNCPDDQSFVRALDACVTPENCAVHYDFNGHSDGIKLTVTGVMDVSSAEGGSLTDLGNVSSEDAERLTCQATSVVYPNRLSLVRYFVNREGSIRWVSEANYAGEAARFPFARVSRQGILSISAHPRNFGIWVLKEGGELTRYGNCGGVPINCDTETPNSDAVMDDGTTGAGLGILYFQVPSSIRMIGVDYQRGLLYGLTKGGSNVFEIRKSSGDSILTDHAGCTTATSPCATDLVAVAPTSVGGTPTPVWYTGTFPNRVTGFFLSPDGSSGYASDLSNDTGLVPTAADYYNSTIYWSNYPNLTAPVTSIPFDAVSFSP